MPELMNKRCFVGVVANFDNAVVCVVVPTCYENLTVSWGVIAPIVALVVVNDNGRQADLLWLWQPG